MKKKKKGIIIFGVVAAVAMIAGGTYWFMSGSKSSSGGSSENTVYVDSVATLAGLGSGNGLNDRFSGVIEPQRTWKIELPSDKKVDEIFVEVGDEVKTGDKLFTYNLEEMEEQLATAEIEMDKLASQIETSKKEIEEVKKQKANASADAQLSYTTKLSSLENEIKKYEYSQKTTQVEINKLKASIANTTVTSEMNGIIKSINKQDSDSNSDYYDGESEPFMTVLAVGDYRVKGVINEQNMASIVEGASVIIRSRVDDTTWKGTLTGVDTENPEKNESDVYYSSSDSSSMTNSSNYPFYVEMENVDGLMLGQHVFIEMDYGQEEEREGIWLDSYYIIQEGDRAYVWAATSKDKIEKRSITLGEFDEDLQQYQIVEGLTAEDYIAYPDGEIAEGDKAEKNTNQVDNTGNISGGSMGITDLEDGSGDMLDELPEGAFDEGVYEEDEDGSMEDEEGDEMEDAE